jgi:leader peptidase (prepilin peptidase)/N-methyltransferase
VLVAITVTDLEARWVPNRIVVPALVVALVVQTVRDPSLEWLLAALAVGGLLFLLAIGPVSVGMGSVKLGAFIGALLGWDALIALALAALPAMTYYGVSIARERTMRVVLVRTPRFLALGGIVALFAGPAIADWLKSIAG